MKLQISSQQWRLRVSEDELQTLRYGRSLTSTSVLPGDATFCFKLELVPALEPRVVKTADSWKISLPTASIDAYVQRLPCRDGVDFVLLVGTDTTLDLAFEVDVRDSIRHRGARPRQH